jgi:hypothetical protein
VLAIADHQVIVTVLLLFVAQQGPGEVYTVVSTGRTRLLDGRNSGR